MKFSQIVVFALDYCFQFYVCTLYLLYLNLFVFVFRLTRNKTIAVHDRLTIYFHAVLSKDFKFDPKEDRVFIRAGSCIGTWKENAVELFVQRYVFLNELSVKLRWWLSLWAHQTMMHPKNNPPKPIFHLEKNKFEIFFNFLC